MSSLASVLKSEIMRLSRREARRSNAKLRKGTAALKKAVAELKRRCVRIDKQLRLIAKSAPGRVASTAQDVSDTEIRNARPTAKMVRALRAKFGISQREMGKLLGVSTQSIFLWEKKEGRLRPRGESVSALLRLRPMGKRQVKAALGAMK